ncbi:MAG TPA: hypothetical protein VHZ07_05345 [Bryobacteraceae bacterium]|jgi:hypothetical protein|nr:hypothetical protein [Bryobacteraceae bacterium]
MRCKEREKGSAILIVFLFAAFVAIMLYEEMPVMAFEAQRAKEQLLIDRGNEYKQAVKVYWTHFQGRFPPNIDALENTNNIRFLRHRYKDPLTGKDDWRLLHMAPGGLGLIDSKVNPLPTNVTQNGANGQSSFGSGSSPSGFGGTGFGAQPAAATGNSISGPVGFAGSNLVPGGVPSGAPEPNNVGGPPVYNVPQRPPAIAANGSGVPNTTDPTYDPNDPKNFINPNKMSALINPQQNPDGPSVANPGQSAQAPNQAPANQTSPNQRPNPVQQIYGMLSNQGAPAQGSPGAFNQPGSSNTTGTSTFGSNNATNNTLGGMIAGVASIAKGSGIKIINDQHEYSKWEFWFNPQEANVGANVAGGSAQANPSTNNPSNTNSQAPGSSSSSSSFGNFGGAFNNNGANTTPAAPLNPQPQPQ